VVKILSVFGLAGLGRGNMLVNSLLPTSTVLFLARPALGIVLSNNNQRGGSFSNRVKSNLPSLNVGLIVPYSLFREKQYRDKIAVSVKAIHKKKYNWLQKYSLSDQQVHFEMMSINPSPTVILKTLCDKFLENNVTTIIYMTNSENFGRATAASQYFLQLAGYLGIPVIGWNADNSGLERRSHGSSLRVQLAPSLEHQVAAMIAIMYRYNWKKFAVVTSAIAGHDDFIQAVREEVSHMKNNLDILFYVQAEVKVTKASHMDELVNSDTRIILLYSTKGEANDIMGWAAERELTGTNFVWVVTQSVIGEMSGQPPRFTAKPQFPIGMLGVSFETSYDALIGQIPLGLNVFAHSVEQYLKVANRSLAPRLSCMEDVTTIMEARWKEGENLQKHISRVSVRGEDGKPHIRFHGDGSLRNAELNILNLRRGMVRSGSVLQWEKIGVWQSWELENHGLDVQDIVWPGESHVPPPGVPEKFHITIGFLEEPPFITLKRPDHVSGKCHDRGILCRVKPRGANETGRANGTSEDFQCCSGFCIDLLAKFAEDLQFEFDLIRVEDPKWGSLINGKWNGLMASLVEKKYDLVLTALKINAERESAVDFTAPFLESGTAILVAKRTGIISPTAFLEPFSAASWMITGVAAVQISALVIFLFEWLSPAGYNMKCGPAPDHKFSLFRTYWLVWALLFQAPVQMDCPRAFTARFMASVWALFAVVFLAIYTANLAAFMITREEWDQFIGIDDARLSNPQSLKPPLKFGTVPWTYSDNAIRKHFPEMHRHMSNFQQLSVEEAGNAVKRGDLHAFIYDGTVLEFIVGQDQECRLLTVGAWYSMTGYGVAFPRKSKYFQSFNRKVVDYSENGDLERLRRFWMTGTCKPKKEEKRSSEPLAPEQFLSAFFLLMCGVLLAACLCSLEHFYFRYIRNRVEKTDHPGCCALVSLSVGKSLTFRGTVFEASHLIKSHKCADPVCDTQLLRIRHELEVARSRLTKLQSELQGRRNSPQKEMSCETVAGTPGLESDFSVTECANDSVCSVRDQDPAANSLIEQISDLEDEEYDNSYKSEHAGRHEIREIETVL